MRFIVKPLGAVVILGFVAGVTALVVNKMHPSAGPSGVPTMVSNLPEKALSATGASAAGWKVAGDGQSIEKASLGIENETIALPSTALTPGQGEFSVTVKGLESGKTSPYPKYGIRVDGEGPQDNFSLWIDPVSKVVTTVGRVGDFNFDWHTTPLPAGFDMTQEHTLRISWSNEGKEWTFSLDKDENSLQKKHIARRLTPTGLALVTHDTRALYTHFAMR